MKNEKILKEEMRDVKGGFNPEFTVKDSDDAGMMMNVYYICINPYTKESCRPVTTTIRCK
jgi:hypothetical protein